MRKTPQGWIQIGEFCTQGVGRILQHPECGIHQSESSPSGYFAIITLNISEECGGSYNAMTGSITSPNYPEDYTNNADCEWYIRGPTGHYLTLTFGAFELQGPSDGNVCSNDTLEIRELNETGQ